MNYIICCLLLSQTLITSCVDISIEKDNSVESARRTIAHQFTLMIFNVRSVGKNKSSDEITVGDKFLELFLHSVGVILTSVQDTEMK